MANNIDLVLTKQEHKFVMTGNKFLKLCNHYNESTEIV